MKKATQRLKDGREHCEKWQKEAKDDFDFIAGNQWIDEDKAILEDQQRPIVVFNYSEKMIDAVNGAEVSGRQEATYRPRGIEDGPLAEVWTEAARWCRDECLADDEESDAFRDCLISGMGWTETKMDYTEDKDGMPIISRIDCTEMVWDPASTKPSLADRRWDAQGVWMDDDLIALRWPSSDVTASVDENGDPPSVFHIQTGNRYNGDNETEREAEDDKRVDQTRIWNYQCMEMETYYRVSAGDGKVVEMEPKDFNKIKGQIKEHGLKYAKLWKKVYYRGFITDEDVLEFSASPCQDGFTRNCITGKRDRNRNIWYGLTRVMKDPQRWANKWLSQIMHIINSNSKGGLLAETGAFVDPRKAEDDWSKANSLVLLNEGGIEKIKEKKMAEYPAGLSQLMEFALNALPQVTGINLEALGLANRDQANVLEQSRKQAAYGLLAPIFDSLKRYRKMQGRIMLFFIKTFISDGRLIRIVGPGSEQYVPLTKVDGAVKFDVVVDQAPTSPDVKQRTWETLMQIVPALVKEGVPVPPDLLTYAPLPQKLIMEWQQFIQKSQQAKGPSPEQLQQMQDQIKQLTEENQQLKTNHDDKMVVAQSKAQEGQAKLAMEKEKQDFEMQLEQQKAEFEMRLEMAQAQNAAQLQEMQANHAADLAERTSNNSMALAQKSNDGNLKIKAAQAGLDPQKEPTIKVDNTDVTEALKAVTDTFAATMKDIVGAMNAPKTVVRDSAGKVVGVKTTGKAK